MTEKKMRIKDVGATINLGNYSSLHLTIGEPSEYAGISLDKATDYLKEIARRVDGVLNLPEDMNKTKKSKKKGGKAKKTNAISGQKIYSFANATPIYYDHATHAYTSEEGVRYDSVTQMLGTFYPFTAQDKIAHEYMDFASSFGNLIHTAVQNAIIGKPPKKSLLASVLKDVMEAIGDYDQGFVEQPLVLPEQELAGRFDIITKKDEKYTLWDVKTNSDLYAPVDCSLPEKLKEKYGEEWGVETIYGEHCFQLNLYAYIIEHTTDIKIDEIKIIHIPDNFKGIVDVPKVDVSDLLTAYGSIR